MMRRRVLVCGGREFDDFEQVAMTLSRHMQVGDVLVHGGCEGADTLAGRYWSMLSGIVEIHYADWDQYGRRAGPVRNQQMLDSGIDFVVVFPGGRGTADMVRRCKAAGVPGVVIKESNGG